MLPLVQAGKSQEICAKQIVCCNFSLNKHSGGISGQFGNSYLALYFFERTSLQGV